MLSHNSASPRLNSIQPRPAQKRLLWVKKLAPHLLPNSLPKPQRALSSTDTKTWSMPKPCGPTTTSSPTSMLPTVCIKCLTVRSLLLPPCRTRPTKWLLTVVLVTTSTKTVHGWKNPKLASSPSRRVGPPSLNGAKPVKSSFATAMVTCSASPEKWLAKANGLTWAFSRITRKAILTMSTPPGREWSPLATTTTSSTLSLACNTPLATPKAMSTPSFIVRKTPPTGK